MKSASSLSGAFPLGVVKTSPVGFVPATEDHITGALVAAILAQAGDGNIAGGFPYKVVPLILS